MDKAAEEATKSGHEWALDHLPPVLLCGGFQRPNRRIVRDLFRVLCSANKEYAYERGQMRFVVQKPLYPFKILTNVCSSSSNAIRDVRQWNLSEVE